MSLLELFIDQCLTKKERVHVSEPLNTRHQAMFDCFKKGIDLGMKGSGV